MKMRIAVIIGSLLLGLPGLSTAGVSVLGNATLEKAAHPGESYQGILRLGNNGPDLQDVKLYQTDYLFYADGRNEFGEPGKASRSNASWIAFRPRRLTIAAGRSAEVQYTVTVPLGADLIGTYWSVLMVEGMPKDSPSSDSADKNKARVGLKTVLRFAVQIVTHIGNTGAPGLKFQKTGLTKETGKTLFQTDLENTGQVWLRPSIWIDVFDDKGKSIGRFKGGQRRTYPGTSVRVQIDISSIPAGKYKAMIVADNGDRNVFGAQFTLTI
jgi:hypothetical protein